MNDLAELALHGLDVARREVAARPMLGFAALGFAVSGVVVVSGAQVAAQGAARPATSWLGLLPPHAVRTDDTVAGVALLVGIVALIALWLVVVEFLRRRAQPERRVWATAAAWATPFVVGPPLMDTTIYSYTAFGLLQRNGADPYRHGATHLGAAPIVAAIDPSARGVPSGAGPLGTLAQHLAVSISAGSVLGAVLVLRAAGVLVAVAIGRLAADLAGTSRNRALSLTLLNPLVLLYVVSGAHLDGLMIAFVLAALHAADQRRWLVAAGAAAVAGSIAAPGFLAVPVILLAHWHTRRAGGGGWPVVRDAAVAGGVIAAAGLLVPDGFGWLRTITKQFASHTPFSIAGGTAKLLSPIVRGASYDDLADGARFAALIALAAALGFLLATARNRTTARTVGYALLAAGLLAPVLEPWYLLWGALGLAPNARGERRIAVLALCALGCLLSPPGFSTTTANALTTAALVAVAAVTTAVLIHRQRRLAALREVLA